MAAGNGENNTTVKLHEIADVLEKWKGFEDGGEGESLWELFDKYKENFINFIKEQIKKNRPDNDDNFNKLLYASVCLLSPENKKSTELEQYNQIVDSGWGILVFNGADKKGWEKIHDNEKEREEHFQKRASLYKICKDYRGNTCEQDSNNRKCCKNNFEPTQCNNYKACRGYFELVKVRVKKNGVKLDDRTSGIFGRETENLREHIEKTSNDDFSRYLEWMCDNTGECYYFRKPLVKGVKDFDAGEIYLAMEMDLTVLSEEDAAAAEQTAIETIRVIRDYIGVPLLVRQMDLEHKSIKKEKEKYEKSERMFNLLNKPLESLTGALEKVQRDSQSLRAILYDPHRSIFAAASRVQEFFTHKKVVSIGDVRWEIEHDANNYKSVADLTSTLSGIIMEIFGSDYRPENPSDLFNHAMYLVFRETTHDPFERLRKTCKNILGFNDDDISKISNILWKGEPFNKNDSLFMKVIKAVTAFKYILHYPFKPSETARMNYLPLMVILDDIDYVGEIFFSEGGENKINSNVNATSSFLSGANEWNQYRFRQDGFPLPCYSHFMDFVSGFLTNLKTEIDTPPAYHRSKGAKKLKIAKITITENSLNIEIGGYQDDKIKRTLKSLKNDIKKAIEWESRVHGGDSIKPFLDLIYNAKSMYRKEQVKDKVKVKCARKDNTLTISLGAAEIKYDKSGLAFSF